MKGLLQRIANNIITKMESAETPEVFEFYYEFGIWLDGMAIDYFGIYLE